MQYVILITATGSKPTLSQLKELKALMSRMSNSCKVSISEFQTSEDNSNDGVLTIDAPDRKPHDYAKIAEIMNAYLYLKRTYPSVILSDPQSLYPVIAQYAMGVTPIVAACNIIRNAHEEEIAKTYSYDLLPKSAHNELFGLHKILSNIQINVKG